MLPVTIQSLLNSLNAGQSDSSQKEAKDGFSSLLSILGRSKDDDKNTDSAPMLEDSDTLPPAAAIDMPSILFADPATVTSRGGDIIPDNDSEPVNELVDPSAKDAVSTKDPAAKNSAKESTPDPRDDKVVRDLGKSENTNQPANKTSAKTAAAVQSKPAAPADATATESTEDLQHKLQAIRALLSDLLGILAQFGKGGAFVSIEQSQTVTVSVIPATDLAALGFMSTPADLSAAVQSGLALSATSQPILNAASQMSSENQSGDAMASMLDRLGLQLQSLLAQLRGNGESFASQDMSEMRSLLSDLDLATAPITGQGPHDTSLKLEKLMQHMEKMDLLFAGLMLKAMPHDASLATDKPLLSAVDIPQARVKDMIPSAPSTSQDTSLAVGIGNASVQTESKVVQGAPPNNANAAGMASMASVGSQQSQGGGQDPANDNAFGLPTAARVAQPQAGPGAEKSVFARMLDQNARLPLLDQVTFHIRSAISGGSSHIRIQLEPADLGKLDIKLEVAADGKTSISIMADKKDTLDLLQRDSRALERALAEAGLKPDSGSLSFNLRGGSQQEPEYGQASSQYQKAQPEEPEPVVEILTKSYVVDLAEGLDIRI